MKKFTVHAINSIYAVNDPELRRELIELTFPTGRMRGCFLDLKMFPLEANFPLTYAKCDGNIIGWCLYIPSDEIVERYNAQYRQFYDRDSIHVYVRPDIRMNGIGKRLVKRMKQYIPSENCHAWGWNAQSINFFESIDFPWE